MATLRSPIRDDAIPGASPCVLALRRELLDGEMEVIDELEFAGHRITIALGSDSLWALIRRGGARLAVRTAYSPGGLKARRLRGRKGEALRLQLTSAVGRHVVSFSFNQPDLPLVRITTRLTPAQDLLIPHLPRDVYPLGPDDDPLTARGNVEAAQRGLNGGLLYFRLDHKTPASFLYVQNLTALNPYFNATQTKPDGAVGGEWPELGYLPPSPPQSGTPPVNPLPKGQEIMLSDAILVLSAKEAKEETEAARLFVQMLASAYRLIDKPEPVYRDWVGRAERTANDLTTAPEATVRHYGHVYVHPYTASEYPDSMVQLITLASLHDYGVWRGKPLPIEKELKGGIDRFFDPALGSIRRYLPNVGADKDADAVDSWYLYRPLIDLGRLAQQGDEKARRLFDQSIGFAIKAAHHFKYKWPIQYKITDFTVIQKARDDQGLGQTDVGGIYAYLMIVAFELTDDPKYLAEARKAIDAARGMRFELNYQANLTAWGAAACMRLWRITSDEYYLRQGYVYLASFFHNSVIWDSDIGDARRYPTFLAVSALHDGPYMALYECFDSFAAFEKYLKDSGPDLDPSVRLLVSEYCRYTVNRAWFYYPDTLPEEMICKKPRNGHVDRNLSFPVEDLYVGGDIAGQVGQEIYGAGAAFIFVARCFHHVADAPFMMFCDHFLVGSQRTSESSLSFQLVGDAANIAKFSIIRTEGKRLPRLRLSSEPGGELRGQRTRDGRVEFSIPANARVQLDW